MIELWLWLLVATLVVAWVVLEWPYLSGKDFSGERERHIMDRCCARTSSCVKRGKPLSSKNHRPTSMR